MQSRFSERQKMKKKVFRITAVTVSVLVVLAAAAVTALLLYHKGRLDGYSGEEPFIDRNVFNGSRKEFDKWRTSK